MECCLIWSLMTMIRDNSSAARGHAVREAGEQFFVERLPLLLQNPLHFVRRASEPSFDARLEDAPQILDGVEVRRVGWEVERSTPWLWNQRRARWEVCCGALSCWNHQCSRG